MNIIEAAKALLEDSVVRDPCGFKIHNDRWDGLRHEDDSEYVPTLKDILSENGRC